MNNIPERRTLRFTTVRKKGGETTSYAAQRNKRQSGLKNRRNRHTCDAQNTWEEGCPQTYTSDFFKNGL